MKNIQDLCLCGFVWDRITDEVFQCFDASPQAVTYRAVLHGTASTTSSQLISQIEQWTTEGAGITIQQVLMRVDGSCRVSLSTLIDDECQPKNKPDTTTVSINSGGIIGGAVAMVMILVVTVVLMVVAALCVKKHRVPSQSNDDNRYMCMSSIVMTSVCFMWPLSICYRVCGVDLNGTTQHHTYEGLKMHNKITETQEYEIPAPSAEYENMEIFRP